MNTPTRYVDQLRQEMLEAVVELVDAYSQAARLVDQYPRGYRANGYGGGNSKGGISDPTAQAALNHTDPAAQLEEFMRFVTSCADRMQAGRARWAALVDVRVRFTQKQAQAITDRGNNIETCAACGLPAPTVKRVDGKPYHPEQCYWEAWRQQQAIRT